MKKILLVIAISHMAYAATSQDSLRLRSKPFLTAIAIMVSNIDSSSLWYKDVFEMNVTHRMNNERNGSKVAILESDNILIELIEPKLLVSAKKALQDEPPGTQIMGFFKAGFKVPDMNSFISRLSDLKIRIDYIYGKAEAKNRNFGILDPDGNNLQFFE